VRATAIGVGVVVAVLGLGVGAAESVPSEGDPLPRSVSTDPTYGVTEANPIKVGRAHGGPRDEQLYLSALRGPDGQPVKSKRLGSCCHFDTPNDFGMGLGGLLDKYEVKHRGVEKPVLLFLNMYDYEQPVTPMGFTVAK